MPVQDEEPEFQLQEPPPVHDFDWHAVWPNPTHWSGVPPPPPPPGAVAKLAACWYEYGIDLGLVPMPIVPAQVPMALQLPLVVCTEQPATAGQVVVEICEQDFVGVPVHDDVGEPQLPTDPSQQQP